MNQRNAEILDRIIVLVPAVCVNMDQSLIMIVINGFKYRDHKYYKIKKVRIIYIDNLIQGSNPKFEQTAGTSNVIHSIYYLIN